MNRFRVCKIMKVLSFPLVAATAISEEKKMAMKIQIQNTETHVALRAAPSLQMDNQLQLGRATKRTE